MKKTFFTFLLAFATIGLYAQSNVAYIYSSEILDAYPSYIKAISKIDEHVKSVQEEIDENTKKAKSLFGMYSKFSNSLQSSELTELKEMIMSVEEESKKIQDAAYGENGSIEKLKNGLLKTIEAELLAAVDKIANAKGYDMIFDLSIMKNTLYQSEKVNLTELVKNELGIK